MQRAALLADTVSRSKSEASPNAVPGLLQMRWQVADLHAAAAQVSEWVSARRGFAVATNEHHLSISLPASEVSSFIQQFSSGAASTPEAPESSHPSWVSISLELAPFQ